MSRRMGRLYLGVGVRGGEVSLTLLQNISWGLWSRAADLSEMK